MNPLEGLVVAKASTVGRMHPRPHGQPCTLLCSAGHTFPKISSGRPMYANILLRSDVRNDCGHESVGARAARGGDPQSSSVDNKPVYSFESMDKKEHVNNYQGLMI